jgi:leucyl/phenylalanyl-tRNA--protein transferase
MGNCIDSRMVESSTDAPPLDAAAQQRGGPKVRPATDGLKVRQRPSSGAAHDEHAALLRLNPWLRGIPYIHSIPSLHVLLTVLYKGLPHEFCWSCDLSPRFVAEVSYHGFVPMAERTPDGQYIMLPKMHVYRCLLQFGQLHIPKKVRKRASAFHVTVDTCFDAVVTACQAQHTEEGCWLHAPLMVAFRALHHPRPMAPSDKSEREVAAPEPTGAAAAGATGATGPASGPASSHAAAAAGSSSPGAGRGVRLHSIEVWRGAELVAGEVGLSVGATYTSLSGFYTVSSSGTVQCVATALMLRRAGYAYWDLGMELPYKMQLGATTVPRATFLGYQHAARERTPDYSVASAARTWVPDLLPLRGAADEAGVAAAAPPVAAAPAPLAQHAGDKRRHEAT